MKRIIIVRVEKAMLLRECLVWFGLFLRWSFQISMEIKRVEKMGSVLVVGFPMRVSLYIWY